MTGAGPNTDSIDRAWQSLQRWKKQISWYRIEQKCFPNRNRKTPTPALHFQLQLETNQKSLRKAWYGECDHTRKRTWLDSQIRSTYTHSWKAYDAVYGLVFNIQEQKRLIYDDISPVQIVVFFPGWSLDWCIRPLIASRAHTAVHSTYEDSPRCCSLRYL